MQTSPLNPSPEDSSRREPVSEAERVRLLASILEAFAETLDLNEVLRRIVEITRQTFDADRAWLLYPADPDAEFTTAQFEATKPEYVGAASLGVPIPLANARPIVVEALASEGPVVFLADDLRVDPQLFTAFSVRSQMLMVLRPNASDQPWVFGMHQCAYERHWSDWDRQLFSEIARYATLAINNAELHRLASSEAAKVNAILNHIPEAAAIYDETGRLERLNAAAERERHLFVGNGAEQPAAQNDPSELPSMKALRGQIVNADVSMFDNRRNENRRVNFRAAPIRNEAGEIIGSVVVSRDVTEERMLAEKEAWRRRRVECLSTLSLDLIGGPAGEPDFEAAAARVAETVNGNTAIYMYSPGEDALRLVGATYQNRALVEHVRANPYRPGEGLAGTVFQIGRPLLFSDVRGDAVVDFGRSEEEKALKRTLGETSLIASPVEWYGERVGAVVVSLTDSKRTFDADDIEFVRAVCDRIGVAWHIHRLTRVAQEGHRAAEELARREVDARSRLEAVLESAPIGIAVVSPDELRFEMANSRLVEIASQFSRITPDTRIIDLRVAEVLPGWERALTRVAEGGDRIEDLLQLTNQSQTRYFNRIISPVRGRYSGATQNLTVLVQDVTDQTRAKREIEALAQLMEERSARLDSILGSMTDGLWVYDVDGNVVDVNQAALDLFGIGSRSEAVARGRFEGIDLRYPDGRLIPPDDYPQVRALRGLVVPDYLAIGRHLITGKDLDLSIAVAPIESGGTIVGAVLVIRDITGIQELDRKKDEFLSVASHELRTPLTTIKGYTQLLAQVANDVGADDRNTYLMAVLAEIERMMGLISELLDVSRIDTNRLQIYPQAIPWLHFLEQQASAFRVRHPSREIVFREEIPETTLYVDPDRMRQVVDNLFSNALKYSPEQSEIEVLIGGDGTKVTTSVIDRGIGIPKDEIPQLFERFHRARNVSSRYYGGLGLGLYIAKGIVEAHGGTIHVESEEGAGSTFTLSLPVNPQETLRRS